MDVQTFRTRIDGERADSIVSAVRTSLGDELRSLLYFTPSEFDVLYVRRDLADDPATDRERRAPLVDIETVGFVEAPVRSTVSAGSEGSSIGEYGFTIRFHDDGFVVRVLSGDAGVLFTTDSMDVAAFRDAATAVTRFLTES
jgi:hypothetical protein